MHLPETSIRQHFLGFGLAKGQLRQVKIHMGKHDKLPFPDLVQTSLDPADNVHHLVEAWHPNSPLQFHKQKEKRLILQKAPAIGGSVHSMSDQLVPDELADRLFGHEIAPGGSSRGAGLGRAAALI